MNEQNTELAEQDNSKLQCPHETTEFEALLTLEDAAKLCAVSTNMLRRMISRGELKAVRGGTSKTIRIRPEDLEAIFVPVVPKNAGEHHAA